MGLFNKLFHGFFYVVDKDILKKHLEEELNFTLDNNLEASANLNIYLGDEKHHVQIWNHGEADPEGKKGVYFYYDENEYHSLEELSNAKLNSLPEYFKIELIDADSPLLNEYKKSHPELNVEDY